MLEPVTPPKNPGSQSKSNTKETINFFQNIINKTTSKDVDNTTTNVNTEKNLKLKNLKSTGCLNGGNGGVTVTPVKYDGGVLMEGMGEKREEGVDTQTVSSSPRESARGEIYKLSGGSNTSLPPRRQNPRGQKRRMEGGGGGFLPSPRGRLPPLSGIGGGRAGHIVGLQF